MTSYYFNKGDIAPGTVYYIFQTGEYSPEDLVPCCESIDSDKAVVAFQANFLATGNHV
jgi:hypothetical protein